MLLFSSFCFAAMSAFVRLAGDLPFFEKALFRNLGAALAAALVLIVRRTYVSVPRSCALPLALRTICGIISVFCNYYAIDHLLLASSNSLSKLSPFFSILFAAVFLNERVDKKQFLCIAVALIGSLFLIVPGMDTLGFASCVALIGGISSGAIHTTLRALQRHQAMDGTVIVFIYSTVATAVTAIPCLFLWSPPSSQQILCLLGVAISSAVAQFALTAAYRYGAPREISIFDCAQIIFAGLMGYFLFGQVPPVSNFIAYALIIAASLLLFLW